MEDKDLYEYIKNKRCFCCFCVELKKKVLAEGVKAIDEYQGMICGGVEDMQIRRIQRLGACQIGVSAVSNENG